MNSTDNAARKNSLLADLYKEMRRIRTFEERVGELFVRGQSAGSMLHLSIGEESAAVGVATRMRDGDTFTTHHRGHGIFLARGADPNRMMAEIAGKEAGYCHGKGGSMHIADMSLGHLGANAIVGGGIPAVVGAGIAARNRNNGAVSVAFFGDGATGQGILYESLNMAALWKLPVMFVCINNQYGMGTRIDNATANTKLHERAIAFGLEARTVDGLDVETVADAAAELIAGARNGRPAFLSIDCYRFYGHARKDKSPYRDDMEEERGRQKDPLTRARATLIERGILSEDELEKIDVDIDNEMDNTIDFSTAQAEPQMNSMFSDVYDPSQPEPEPVRTRLHRVLARE
ncbi:MAG: thiamine pyrophosphate-dependent dehydrogenase E1 component subunit alpha [Pseudomonadota bacterium]